MSSFLSFVRGFSEAFLAALPKSAVERKQPCPQHQGPVVLLLSPHPDDECVTGALPLRLQRECGARVVNVAMTLGSSLERREPRRAELLAACTVLDWECEFFPCALADHEAANALRAVLERLQPAWVFYPHAADFHPAHLAVNALAQAALGPSPDAPLRIETEFWHPNSDPNLLVESTEEELALLLEALSCHTGEIARNPYHRRLPASMMESVRRGAERVGGAGVTAPDFLYGTLYRVQPALPAGWSSILTANLLRNGGESSIVPVL